MNIPSLGRFMAIGFAAVAVFTGVAAARAAQPSHTSIFRPVLHTLRRTGVPLLLPTVASLNRYYAYVELSRRGQYAVLLGYIRNCDGDACEYGELTAQTLPEHASGPRGVAVRLAGGYTGVYYNFTCGASCGASTVTVIVRGYEYTYGIKAGRRADVLAMANSALRAGPVS